MSSLNGNSFLQAYLNLNKLLVKTMVIKSATSVETLNDHIKFTYGESAVDQFHPETWKYYQNISGEYHTLDTLMTVTSLDTLQEISFTKENLLIHTSTAEAYGYGSRYYYSLLARYPNQEQLIIGILYPVDKAKAIASEDGTILGYPKGLVEVQERTLMIELEEFIKRHLVRWNVQAYGLVDSLYNTSYHIQLYLALLPKLINLRGKRCKTDEAHSFHIRQYLASHGKLDKYLPYLTLKQALYLYRNINYIEKHTGRTDMAEELVQKILTERQIPLAEYSIRQLSTFDNDYYPNVVARRKPINDQFNMVEKDYIDIATLNKKEMETAYGNPRYFQANEIKDGLLYKTSKSSVIQTKDLESSMIDYNDAIPDPLEIVLMRQWASLASSGYYDVVVTFKDPRSSEFRSLYAKDALIYYIYVMLNSIDVPMDKVPEYMNIKARKLVKPTMNELLSVADNRLSGMKELAKDLIDNQPQITECFSSSGFYDLTYKIYEESRRQWVVSSNIHDLDRRAAAMGMIYQFYYDEWISFPESGQSMVSWLTERDFTEYDYSRDQANELLRNIFTKATGLTIDDTKALKNVQKMLIELMKDLSSYTVQYIREINDSRIKLLNWAAIRLGNFDYAQDAAYQLNDAIRINDMLGLITVVYPIKTKIIEIAEPPDRSHSHAITVPTGISVVYSYADTRTFHVPFGTFKLNTTYDGYDPALSDSSSYVGEETYLALTDEQKQSIPSLY